MALTELAVSRDLGWLFREQLESDRGVDAHIEVVLDGRSTGRLVGLQIKTGASYLGEHADDGFVYRPDSRHVEYWLAHSLPVIVVLVDLGAMCAFWQVVGRETLVPTGRNWKIVVPFGQKLTADSRAILAKLADATPYTLRFRQYQLARRLPVLRLGLTSAAAVLQSAHLLPDHHEPAASSLLLVRDITERPRNLANDLADGVRQGDGVDHRLAGRG